MLFFIPTGSYLGRDTGIWKPSAVKFLPLYIYIYMCIFFNPGINIQSDNHDSIEDSNTAIKLYFKYNELTMISKENFKLELDSLYNTGRHFQWKIPENHPKFPLKMPKFSIEQPMLTVDQPPCSVDQTLHSVRQPVSSDGSDRIFSGTACILGRYACIFGRYGRIFSGTAYIPSQRICSPRFSPQHSISASLISWPKECILHSTAAILKIVLHFLLLHIRFSILHRLAIILFFILKLTIFYGSWNYYVCSLKNLKYFVFNHELSPHYFDMCFDEKFIF